MLKKFLVVLKYKDSLPSPQKSALGYPTMLKLLLWLSNMGVVKVSYIRNFWVILWCSVNYSGYIAMNEKNWWCILYMYVWWVGKDWKEVVVAYLKILSWNLAGMTEENHERSSFRISAAPAQIQTHYLLNTKQKCPCILNSVSIMDRTVSPNTYGAVMMIFLFLRNSTITAAKGCKTLMPQIQKQSISLCMQHWGIALTYLFWKSGEYWSRHSRWILFFLTVGRGELSALHSNYLCLGKEPAEPQQEAELALMPHEMWQ